jgi:hypothetical protein
MAKVPYWVQFPGRTTYSSAETFDEATVSLGANYDVVRIDDIPLPGICKVHIVQGSDIAQMAVYKAPGKTTTVTTVQVDRDDATGRTLEALKSKAEVTRDDANKAAVLKGTKTGTIDDVRRWKPAVVTVTMRIHDEEQLNDWAVMRDAVFYSVKNDKVRPFRISHALTAVEGISEVHLQDLEVEQPSEDNDMMWINTFTFVERRPTKEVVQTATSKKGKAKGKKSITGEAASRDGKAPPSPHQTNPTLLAPVIIGGG